MPKNFVTCLIVFTLFILGALSQVIEPSNISNQETPSAPNQATRDIGPQIDNTKTQNQLGIIPKVATRISTKTPRVNSKAIDSIEQKELENYYDDLITKNFDAMNGYHLHSNRGADKQGTDTKEEASQGEAPSQLLDEIKDDKSKETEEDNFPSIHKMKMGIYGQK